MLKAGLGSECGYVIGMYVSCSLNSLGDYIGEYYGGLSRGILGVLMAFEKPVNSEDGRLLSQKQQ